MVICLILRVNLNLFLSQPFYIYRYKFLNCFLIRMKQQLAIMALLLIVVLSQNSVTTVGKADLQTSGVVLDKSIQITAQDLLAQIPNHNKPVSLLNPEKYSSRTAFSALDNSAQRPTENVSSNKEIFSNSIEKVQLNKPQNQQNLINQIQYQKQNLKQSNQQKNIENPTVFKKLAVKDDEPPQSRNNIDKKAISPDISAQQVRKQKETTIEEKSSSKNASQPTTNQKIIVFGRHQERKKLEQKIEVKEDKNQDSITLENNEDIEIQKNINIKGSKNETTFEKQPKSKSSKPKTTQKQTKTEKTTYLKQQSQKNSSQSKKNRSQLVQAQKQGQNDIKIIPLSSQYGKEKPKSEDKGKQKFRVSNKNKSKEQVNLRSNERRSQSQSRVSQKKSKNQTKKLQKLIQQVKNTKDQLPQQSKQQIIEYLQTKKKQKVQKSELNSQLTFSSQSSQLSQQKIDKNEDSEQYAVVLDEVIEINNQEKEVKQMNNTTIFVIMILTVLISIPIVREIRYRNDNNQDSKLIKDSMPCKQDFQSGEETGQRIIEEII